MRTRHSDWGKLQDNLRSLLLFLAALFGVLWLWRGEHGHYSGLKETVIFLGPSSEEDLGGPTNVPEDSAVGDGAFTVTHTYRRPAWHMEEGVGQGQVTWCNATSANHSYVILPKSNRGLRRGFRVALVNAAGQPCRQLGGDATEVRAEVNCTLPGLKDRHGREESYLFFRAVPLTRSGPNTYDLRGVACTETDFAYPRSLASNEFIMVFPLQLPASHCKVEVWVDNAVDNSIPDKGFERESAVDHKKRHPCVNRRIAAFELTVKGPNVFDGLVDPERASNSSSSSSSLSSSQYQPDNCVRASLLPREYRHNNKEDVPMPTKKASTLAKYPVLRAGYWVHLRTDGGCLYPYCTFQHSYTHERLDTWLYVPPHHCSILPPVPVPRNTWTDVGSNKCLGGKLVYMIGDSVMKRVMSHYCTMGRLCTRHTLNFMGLRRPVGWGLSLVAQQLKTVVDTAAASKYIVLGSALHDLSPYFTVHRRRGPQFQRDKEHFLALYRDNLWKILSAMMDRLRQRPLKDRPRVVWIMGTSPRPRNSPDECLFETAYVFKGVVGMLNRIAYTIVRQFDIDVVFFDAITQSIPPELYEDHIHPLEWALEPLWQSWFPAVCPSMWASQSAECPVGGGENDEQGMEHEDVTERFGYGERYPPGQLP